MRYVIFLMAPCILAATIEGTAVNALTGAQIVGAKVTLKVGDKVVADAVTDFEGRFMLSGLTDGQYRPEWDASGFVRHRGDPFVVAGEATIRLRGALQPYGKISGKITFGSGATAARARVELFGLTRRSSFSVNTNENGRYQFPEVPPGKYNLAARQEPRKSLAIPVREGQRRSWVATFAPGVTERRDADSIVIRPGAEVIIDVPLRDSPIYQVSGTLIDHYGHPVPNASVLLKSRDIRITSDVSAESSADGDWVLPAVPEGDWRLYAESGGLKGFSTIRVSRRDLDNLRIRLEPAFVVSGRVERDEPRDAEGKRRVTAILLIPTDGMNERQTEVFHEMDGSFTLKVAPGRYRITPRGFTPNFYLASVLLGDQDVLTQDVDLYPGAPLIHVIYKPNPGIVSGTVDKGDGSTVVLIPRDDAFRDADGQFLRTTKVGSDGRFEVRNLRPAHYYAVAFDRVEYDMLESAEFVHGIASRLASVSVQEGETVVVNLGVTGWPEP